MLIFTNLPQQDAFHCENYRKKSITNKSKIIIFLGKIEQIDYQLMKVNEFKLFNYLVNVFRLKSKKYRL